MLSQQRRYPFRFIRKGTRLLGCLFFCADLPAFVRCHSRRRTLDSFALRRVACLLRHARLFHYFHFVASVNPFHFSNPFRFAWKRAVSLRNFLNGVNFAPLYMARAWRHYLSCSLSYSSRASFCRRTASLNVPPNFKLGPLAYNKKTTMIATTPSTPIPSNPQSIK